MHSTFYITGCPPVFNMLQGSMQLKGCMLSKVLSALDNILDSIQKNKNQPVNKHIYYN